MKMEDVDAASSDDALIATLFPKHVLRLEPVEYGRVRKEKEEQLSEHQLAIVTTLRRKERACVHAAKSRSKRMKAKATCETDNVRLRQENRMLYSENSRLRQELHVAMGMLAKGPAQWGAKR